MAERRMFAKTIIDSDAFLEMPQSTQALYFHLAMRADDEGFINSPKSIMRVVGCKEDDLKILSAKKFIIPFDSGIVVIKHWRIHNYIAKDRFTETKYKIEKQSLAIDENGSYTTGQGEYLGKSIEKVPLTIARQKRLDARKKSSLPSSFDYKIRNYFEGMICPICGLVMQQDEYTRNRMPTIQHNLPISLGGEHELGNISVVCMSCNLSIQDTPTEELNSKEVSEAWECIGNVSGMDTQVRLGKDRIGKVREENTPAPEVAERVKPISKSVAVKPEPDPLYKAIFDSFILKAGAFSNYPKEANAIKRVIAYCKQHAPKYTDGDQIKLAGTVINQFYDMTVNGDKFWRSQPFTPSALSSLFDRVLVEIKTDEERRNVDDTIPAF